MMTLGFKEDEVSLPKLRSQSIPKLGNVLQASWESLSEAFVNLKYPVKIIEATSRFKDEGGPLLNLLKADPGVFLVSMCVTIDACDGKQNKHCVMLSTIPKRGRPFGKLIDNHGKMVPAYLEKKDTRSKEAAKKAWRKFIGQNPATHDSDFTFTPADVYELKRR